jgi:inosine-uridine nucleoside N-ribohydrolase
MGGGHEVANDAVSRFNIWVDPEAARVVFAAGLRTSWSAARYDPPGARLIDDYRRMRESGTPAGVRPPTIDRRITAYDDAQPMAVAHAPVHDALCIACLIGPTSSRPARPRRVETRGALHGRTVMDTASRRELTRSSRSMRMRPGSCRC